MNLTQLGEKTPLPATPDAAILETIAYVPRKTGADSPRMIVRFTAPEFTSLCPVTGQPDFARIVIDFLPRAKLVESKSLKLFLGSFRNHGAFHESCTEIIGERLFDAMAPYWLRVISLFYARGGIPIDVMWECGLLPSNCCPLPIHSSDFQGR